MASAEDYKRFFDDAPVALLRTDLKTGRFLMANNFAANLFGCDSIEELLKTKRATDYYPIEHRQRLLRNLKRHGMVEEQEVLLVLPTGKRIWVRANFRMTSDGDCIECFMTDITELVVLREAQLLDMQTLSRKIDVRIAALGP